MRVTREEIRAAFEEVLRTGSCVEIGTESGLFLQKGAELNADTPDEEKESGSWAGPYDDESVYLTTDDGAEPVRILGADDAVEELGDMVSPLGQRYVIVDTREHDVYTDILPEGTTEDEARARLGYAWAHLTDAEKKRSVMELVLLAVEGEEALVDWDSDWYQEALERGWHTLSGYTPIEKKEA